MGIGVGNQRSARRRVAGLSAAVALAMAGCGDGRDDEAAQSSGGGQTGRSPEAARFVAVDIDYAEAPDSLSPGGHVFRLVNEGGLAHTVTIEEVDDRTVVEAGGGETATGDVELEPGTYTYYCSVPGHREAGMEGTLEVVEAAAQGS
jgi:plastocyanin